MHDVKNERLRCAYLKQLEIDVWIPRDAAILNNATLDREQLIARMDWEALELSVKQCTACPLHQSRTQAVFGSGSKTADLLVIGEAPGAHEDKQGEPFVGRAGQLLTAMLQAIGLQRQDVYIANVLKSRPPNNRDPSMDEVNACIPYLLRQIELMQPKLILAIGRIAAHYLLNEQRSMAELRGKLFDYMLKPSFVKNDVCAKKIPLIVSYHPAYLLRAPREKAKAWKDMQFVVKTLRQLQSSR